MSNNEHRSVEHPKQFVENIRKYNRAPLGEYFFSAYPTVAVADVINATSDTAAPAVTVADAISATASDDGPFGGRKDSSA